MPVKIITDSTSDITQEEARQLGIQVIPLHVIFGGNVYRDGVDLSAEKFFEILPKRNDVTTSQPNTDEILKIWQTVPESETIISIHISSKLSKTYDRALEAARFRQNTMVLDSLSVTLGLKFLTLEAKRMADAGMNAAAIVKNTEGMRGKIRLFGIFETLKYLKKGGRIGRVEYLAGSLLGIKPVVTLKEGELVPVSRARTMNKGIEIVEKFLSEIRVKSLEIVHASSEKEAVEVKKLLEKKYQNLKISVIQLGPALGVHSGPGFLGIGALVE